MASKCGAKGLRRGDGLAAHECGSAGSGDPCMEESKA